VGANLGATRVNDFPRPANDCGQATGNLPRSRTDLDDAERDTGNYGSEGGGPSLVQEEALTRPGLALNDFVGRAQRNPRAEERFLGFPLRDPDKAGTVVGEVRRLDRKAPRSGGQQITHLTHRLGERVAAGGLRPVQDQEDKAHITPSAVSVTPRPPHGAGLRVPSWADLHRTGQSARGIYMGRPPAQGQRLRVSPQVTCTVSSPAVMIL
jgi:hypothetical protein